VSLPGDIVFRYQTAASLLPQYKNAKPTHVFLLQLKTHVSNLLLSCIESLEKKQTQESCADYPNCVTQEEQGYLALHVLLTPSDAVPRPPQEFLPKAEKKKKIRRKHYETQGGHPRSNMERKLQKQGANVWPVNHAVEMSESLKKKATTTKIQASQHDWCVSTCEPDPESIKPLPVRGTGAMQIHVALWRRPFLVQGNYTKARRDVSQTPFFVNADSPNKRQRLGISSIEEQILPSLTEICGGISDLNNSPDCDNVIYGELDMKSKRGSSLSSYELELTPHLF
jgi:hypothetical protein